MSRRNEWYALTHNVIVVAIKSAISRMYCHGCASRFPWLYKDVHCLRLRPAKRIITMILLLIKYRACHTRKKDKKWLYFSFDGRWRRRALAKLDSTRTRLNSAPRSLSFDECWLRYVSSFFLWMVGCPQQSRRAATREIIPFAHLLYRWTVRFASEISPS